MDINIKRNVKFISSSKDFDLCIEAIEKESKIAVDLEFDKNRIRYGFNLCLMQIYTGSECFLIDPLSREIEINKIFPIFESDAISKVVFAFGEDLRLLHSLGCKPRNIYDLATVSRLLNDPALSLTNLLIEKLEIETTKSSQLSNWFKRPLTDEQFNYAAADVLYLFELQDYFLQHENYSKIANWIDEEIESINTFEYVEETSSSFLKHKDKIGLSEYEWHLFKSLMIFRNEIGEKYGKPVHNVMPAEILKDLANDPSMKIDWKNTPRLYYKIKNESFGKKISSIITEAKDQAIELNLSKTKSAIPELSIDEKRESRKNRAVNEEIKRSVFKPIQLSIAKTYGENIASYMMSNRIMMNVISGNNECLLTYQKELIKIEAQKINIDVSTFL